MAESKASELNYVNRNKKRNWQIMIWSFIWTASMVFVDKAELYGWFGASWMTIVGIVINAFFGLVVIYVYVSFLNELDDLQRKIQTDALAVAMGVSLVSSFTYGLLVTARYITDVEISDITVIMVFTYIASVIYGQVKYR